MTGKERRLPEKRRGGPHRLRSRWTTHGPPQHRTPEAGYLLRSAPMDRPSTGRPRTTRPRPHSHSDDLACASGRGSMARGGGGPKSSVGRGNLGGGTRSWVGVVEASLTTSSYASLSIPPVASRTAMPRSPSIPRVRVDPNAAASCDTKTRSCELTATLAKTLSVGSETASRIFRPVRSSTVLGTAFTRPVRARNATASRPTEPTCMFALYSDQIALRLADSIGEKPSSTQILVLLRSRAPTNSTEAACLCSLEFPACINTLCQRLCPATFLATCACANAIDSIKESSKNPSGQSPRGMLPSSLS
jgi:hypothetical protein